MDNKESLSRDILSSIIVYMKYARYLPKLKRRETWDEIITRNKTMIIKKYPSLQIEIEDIYKNFVYTKKVLPAMRGLQFGGEAIEKNPIRGFNCCTIALSHIDSFKELAFLLMCGSGVGYSVQQHHIEQLPEIKKAIKERRFLIADSIEGWAEAIGVLINAYFGIRKSMPVFDFSEIRPKGALLKTSGGLAPGPEPLHDCIHNISKILERKKDREKLTTLEAHDIACFIADCVVVGGTRRSSCNALFTFDDKDILECKFGDWYILNPQRGRANNSAVILRHKITEEEFRIFLDKMEKSGSGEPGIFLSHSKDCLTNPSLRSGTKVLTTSGVFPIEELENKEFDVVTIDNKIASAKCVLSSPKSILYEITLCGNHKIYCTQEHKWPVVGLSNDIIKTTTDKLKIGDRLPIVGINKMFDGILGNYEDGFLIGWLYGDGWVTKNREGRAKLEVNFIFNQDDYDSGIADRILNHLKYIDQFYRGSLKKDNEGNVYYLQVNNSTIANYLDNFGISRKEDGLPISIWQNGTEDYRRGFIDGLLSSDGHVDQGGKIWLNSSREKIIRDFSDLLGFYGIKTGISYSESKNITFPNGKNYHKTYRGWCLYISHAYMVERFKSLFVISNKNKNKRLLNNVVKKKPNGEFYHYNTYKNSCETIRITKIVKTTIEEPVWDISVNDSTHTFKLAQCITGNCFEISITVQLDGTGGMCNLSEIDVSDVDTQEELDARAKAGGFIATLQAGFTDFHFLRDTWKETVEREALIGVGLTGIASGLVLTLDLKQAAKCVIEENKRVASLISINSAYRTTTVKPSGTASLVLGCSSGIHAWHSEYYIRRIRVSKDEAIYKYLQQYHSELIEDDYFKPTTQAIISVPVKAPEGAITRNETALQLLNRVKRVYNGWVKSGHIKGDNTNNISCTVAVKSHEWEKVKNWLWDNKEHYNAISVLPYDDSVYVQMPFEEITQEKYEELVQHLKKIDLTQIIEGEDKTERQAEAACSGGACEIV